MEQKILVGGQAVIEGVMMRVPGAYATAVRKPDGQIEISRRDFVSLTEKNTFLKKPIFRGIVSLFESVRIGFDSLQFSADIAIVKEEKVQGKESKTSGKFGIALMMIFAFGLAFLFFSVLPLYLTTKLLNIERKAFTFNLVAGCWRIMFFLVYLWLISLMKDIQRLFQYHGAEHKVVFAFEDGRELIPDNTRDFRTFHPRCGTSFIFIILLVSILMFAVIDAMVIIIFGTITLGIRILLHLILLPLVAGVGYEFLKFFAQHQNKKWGKWLSAPGLWLQRITTKQPADDQIEIAIAAIKAAFGDRYAEYAGKKYSADALD